MKILFISDNFPPEVNAPATRTYEHCRLWVEQGHDVTVITCAPNFPQGKLYPGYVNRLWSKEEMHGISIIRVWSYITANEGFFKRILDYVSFSVTAFLAGLFQRFDVVVATSPQFFTTFTGYGLSVIKRRPWVFEVRDLWPESIVAVNAMRRGLAIRLLKKLERFMYRHADLIVTVTPAFKKRLLDYGIQDAKIRVVTNGANLEQFSVRDPDPELLRCLQLRDSFLVGYIGTHGMAHALDFVVETFADLSERLPSLHLICVGDGAQKKQIVDVARRCGTQNVTFLDPVPKDEVPRYLSILSAVIVPLRKSDTFKTVIPSKIFEACAMQKPILLGVEGQAKEIVERFGAGVCFEPENAGSLEAALRSMVNDEAARTKSKEGCQALAKEFDRTRLANKMLLSLVDLKR